MIKEINKTKSQRTYKLFISHSWRHLNALDGLHHLLDKNDEGFKAEYLEVTPNARIDSMDEAYIRRRLSEKIGQADVVLAIGGIYASHSDWMQWELETAKKKGIPALYIAPWGQQHLSVVARQNTESSSAGIPIRLSRPSVKAWMGNPR